jgi:hypothetical protein
MPAVVLPRADLLFPGSLPEFQRLFPDALRRLPSWATGWHQAPPPEIVEYKGIHHFERGGGFSNAIPLRRPVMTYCVSAVLV